MTIPTPILDDRSYDQLRDELLRRIEIYTPEWTDRGASDPGVTLLELVAFLGENLLYRFNQIPDQTQLWLLRLLQSPPRPARPSRGLVTFAPSSPNPPAKLLVPLGTSVAAGAIPFRVGNDVRVLPLTATAMVKATASAPTDAILDEEYQRVLDAAGLDGIESEPFTTVVLGSDPSGPEFEPLDVSTAVDQCLWIAVRSVDGVPPATIDDLFKANGALAADPLTLGFVANDEFPGIDDIDPCEGIDDRPERMRVLAASTAAAIDACEPGFEPIGAEPPGGQPAVVDSTLHWQASLRVPDAGGLPRYVPLAVVSDTTVGLSRTGVVGVQLPAVGLETVGVCPLDDIDLAGVGDRPPAFDGDANVVFWIRAFPRLGVPEIGKLRWADANAADVEQVADASPELVGVGTGMPHQRLALTHPSVVTSSLVLEVEEHGEWVAWELVESFAASSRDDRHVLVDADAGTVTCGDSDRGRTFGIGQRIRATRYRYGGGSAGNVAPRAIKTVTGVDGVTVANIVPTDGGVDAETITHALDRIPGELARHDRAVTASDFEELAALPGVGRAECLPRFEPSSRRFEMAGVVTVMVWPNEDPRHPNAPVPNAGLLRTVCSHLDERRLVTTELYVIPPTYRKVGVSVGLAIKTGYSAVSVRRWVELVLHQYLAPLPPFGPEGTGWPLGHRVHGPELEAAVLQVEGVDFIEDLKVADLSGAFPSHGSVELDGWEVPELAELTIVVGAPPDPGSGPIGPPPSAAPVPVPVPRDEC